MEKLRKIIGQADEELMDRLKTSLKGSASTKFYSLSSFYRDSTLTDDEIRERLNCTESSYYALKSRLFDKVQQLLLDNKEVQQSVKKTDNEGIDLLQYIYEYPSETSIAMLLELEKRFIAQDSPGDLIDVYSALKKANFYTDKYYSYSQLYNNQVAYALAIEKAEEILFNFNRTLAGYYFSDSRQDIEMMEFILKEIKGTYSLYRSPRIEIIHHIIVIQMMLFAGMELKDEPPIDDLLSDCEKILKKFASDRRIRYFGPAINFLNFEYHLSLKQYKKAQFYYEEIKRINQRWLLQNNCCLAFKFLISDIEMAIYLNKTSELGSDPDEMYLDHNDLRTSVIFRLYKSFCSFYTGKVKKSITILNDILNEVSFKNDYFIEAEIKLSLAFYYIHEGEIDLAEQILNGVSRKDPGDFGGRYNNIKLAAKLLQLINARSHKTSGAAKIKEALEQFQYANFQRRKVLGSLLPALEKMGSSKR